MPEIDPIYQEVADKIMENVNNYFVSVDSVEHKGSATGSNGIYIGEIFRFYGKPKDSHAPTLEVPVRLLSLGEVGIVLNLLKKKIIRYD